MRSLPLSTAALALAIHQTTGTAIPGLTATKLVDGCASFKSYNANTSATEPFTVIATSTDSVIDGLPLAIAPFTNTGEDSYGFINVPKRPTYATPNITLRCTTSHLQFAQTSTPSTWTTLFISTDQNWQSSLGYGDYLGPGIDVDLYEHSINGTKQEGVYLGGKGLTEWFFKFNWGGNAGEYYIVRLKDTGYDSKKRGKRQDDGGFPEIDYRDFTGYLRVVGV